MVRAGEPIDEASVRARVARLVDPKAVSGVLAMALNELHNLHEGNVARYRLRGTELSRWVAGLTADRKHRRPVA